MFYNASSFNQNLCSWEFPVFYYYYYSQDMFERTSCPYPSKDPPNYACYDCVASTCERQCNEFIEFKIVNSDYRMKISSYISSPKSNPTPIGCWDTSELTTLYQAFFDKDKFNEDISCWITSKVTSMQVSSC